MSSGVTAVANTMTALSFSTSETGVKSTASQESPIDAVARYMLDQARQNGHSEASCLELDYIIRKPLYSDLCTRTPKVVPATFTSQPFTCFNFTDADIQCERVGSKMHISFDCYTSVSRTGGRSGAYYSNTIPFEPNSKFLLFMQFDNCLTPTYCDSVAVDHDDTTLFNYRWHVATELGDRGNARFVEQTREPALLATLFGPGMGPVATGLFNRISQSSHLYSNDDGVIFVILDVSCLSADQKNKFFPRNSGFHEESIVFLYSYNGVDFYKQIPSGSSGTMEQGEVVFRHNAEACDPHPYKIRTHSTGAEIMRGETGLLPPLTKRDIGAVQNLIQNLWQRRARIIPQSTSIITQLFRAPKSDARDTIGHNNSFTADRDRYLFIVKPFFIAPEQAALLGEGQFPEFSDMVDQPQQAGSTNGVSDLPTITNGGRIRDVQLLWPRRAEGSHVFSFVNNVVSSSSSSSTAPIPAASVSTVTTASVSAASISSMRCEIPLERVTSQSVYATAFNQLLHVIPGVITRQQRARRQEQALQRCLDGKMPGELVTLIRNYYVERPSNTAHTCFVEETT